MGVDKDYLDRQLTSADPVDRKSSVRFATTTALPAYARVGNIITASANGALPAIDGIVPVVGNALLLTDDGTASNIDNGIYEITQLGSGGAPFILTRRGDANANDLVNSGMRVAVEEGTQYQAGTEFVLVTPNPVVLNTTPLDIVVVDSGGAGTLTLVTSRKPVREGTSMLFASDVTIDDGGELDIEGSVEDTEHLQNHSVVLVPRRSERVVQENEVMFFIELTIDGTLTIDGDIEDISPVPFPTPTPPTPPGPLGQLEIVDASTPLVAVAGKLYRIYSANPGLPPTFEVGLPASPADGDTIGFYVVAGFIELFFEIESFSDNVALDGRVTATDQAFPVDGGSFILISWNSVLAQWDIYGAGGHLRLGGLAQTTDATLTVVAAYPTLNNNKTISMHVEVTARDSGNDLTGHYIVEVTAKRDGGGTVTVLDDLFVKSYEDNAAWDVQFSVSGDVILVEVQGDVGNTVEWRVRGTVKEHG